MHLFYCANKPYLFPMAVSLFSAMRAAGTPLAATLALEGVDDSFRDALRSLFPTDSVRIRKIPPGRPNAKYPLAMFARLLVDKLVPREVDRALYLDCDTLVLDDVNELAASIAPGHIVSAVQDDFANWKSGFTDYFNSGVICIDVPAWRAADVGSTCLALVLKQGMSDQQALNTVLSGRWTRLDPRWNVMTHFYTPGSRWDYAAAARQHIGIRHFTMVKPWLSRSRGLGASHFHDMAAQLRSVNPEAWTMLLEAARDSSAQQTAEPEPVS
jgi:lipopolysaccharide biosynthesis glycosyltransferase